nr:hypothetical protein [Plastoroseomonas arctica]
MMSDADVDPHDLSGLRCDIPYAEESRSGLCRRCSKGGIAAKRLRWRRASGSFRLQRWEPDSNLLWQQFPSDLIDFNFQGQQRAGMEHCFVAFATVVGGMDPIAAIPGPDASDPPSLRLHLLLKRGARLPLC